MNSIKKINLRQLCFIIICIFSISKFYVLPARVSGLCKEAGWMAIGLNFLLDFILLLVCVFIIKLKDKSLYHTSTEIFGVPLTKITYFLYAIYFVAKAFIPILEQKNTISLTFYESQPTLLIFMPFFILSFYITAKGVNAFARSVEIIIWIFFIALLIIFALSIPEGRYSAILPLSQPLKKVTSGTYGSLLWFGDPISILFLGDFLSNKKDGILKKTIISYIICTVITLVLIIVFYSIFQGIAERQYYAPIKMSKYSITLSNIGRLDYLGSVMFSTVSIYGISFPMLLACLCLNKVFNLKNTNLLFPSIISIVQAIALFVFQNEIFAHIDFMQKYFLPFFLIMTYLLPLVMLFFVLVFKQKALKLRRNYV